MSSFEQTSLMQDIRL